jgi:hypothetical protein
MPKSKRIKPLKRKEPTPRRRNQAVALLTKWAAASTRVQYIEGSLQHMGKIHKTGSSTRDEFLFIAKCGGAQALIFPSLWSDVCVETGGVAESVVITDHDRTCLIRSWEGAEADASRQAAQTQISNWASLQAVLHILFVGPFPSFSFLGKLAVRENGYLAVKKQDSSGAYYVSTRDGVCKLEKQGDNVTVQITADQYTVSISETEITTVELVHRFSPSSPAVH